MVYVLSLYSYNTTVVRIVIVHGILSLYSYNTTVVRIIIVHGILSLYSYTTTVVCIKIVHCTVQNIKQSTPCHITAQLEETANDYSHRT